MTENIIDLEELKGTVMLYLSEKIIEDLKKNNAYLKVENIKTRLKKNLSGFKRLIDIFKINDINLKSIDIIKQSLNLSAYTWNAYRKAKKSDKVNKDFIKYYDSSYYGLAEWSDEIHKQYFMYAIEEYTVNKPNEKKAKDILKLFKDLDIIDKQDYIEIIESKINRAFK